jgi:hypothetical protein
MMMQWTRPVMIGAVVAMLSGCDAVKNLTDSLSDALDDGPKTSYCESLCDWAVECADGVSELSKAEMVERCDEATNESDAACADAEAGGLALDDAILLSECTDAVQDMSCDGLIGDETDVLTGIPPMACAGYGASDPEGLVGTYNEARNAVMQTGAELCDSVVDEMCGAMVDCLMGDHDVDEAADWLLEQCTDTAFGAFNDRCKESGLYDQTLPLDVNPNRWAVERCVDGFDEADACDPTSWPAECAGAFTPIDGEDLSGLVTGAAGDFLGEFIGL